jgi:hypothetical protein
MLARASRDLLSGPALRADSAPHRSPAARSRRNAPAVALAAQSETGTRDGEMLAVARKEVSAQSAADGATRPERLLRLLARIRKPAIDLQVLSRLASQASVPSDAVGTGASSWECISLLRRCARSPRPDGPSAWWVALARGSGVRQRTARCCGSWRGSALRRISVVGRLEKDSDVVEGAPADCQIRKGGRGH